jgi:hypothetical protein
MTAVITQIAIAIFGLTAVALTQASSARMRRWAPVFGLAGQPFWLYATGSTGQWGMFALCVAYTVVWAVGFRNHWLT